jgi:hypothetical protein
LKRDNKGLGYGEKQPAKVTHFKSMDANAVESAKKSRRKSYIKRLDKEIATKKRKEIKLRQLLS